MFRSVWLFGLSDQSGIFWLVLGWTVVSHWTPPNAVDAFSVTQSLRFRHQLNHALPFRSELCELEKGLLADSQSGRMAWMKA